MWSSNLPAIVAGALFASTASAHAVSRLAARAECEFAAAPNPGDTCESFAVWWGITIAQLVAFNPTLDCSSTDAVIPDQEWCVQMDLPPPSSTTSKDPTGTGAPLPSPTQENVTKDCKAWYMVVKGDTCQKVVDKYKTFSINDFYKWNPDVETDCSGLQLNVYVCVGVAGTPTQPPSTDPTSDPSKPSPTQDNVTKDCTTWHKVVKGDGCQKVVDKYKTFTLAQFYKWNPDVGDDCSALQVDVYVCIGVAGTPTAPPSTTAAPTGPPVPSPTQEHVVKNCRNWYKVVSGDTCQKIVDRYGGTFNFAQFYYWNVDVKSDCSGLPLDTYVCVGIDGMPTARPSSTSTRPPAPTVTGTTPPSPVQSGVSRTCNLWYYVVPDDGCQVIADKFRIALGNFYRWNPAISTTCNNLQVDVYVCVGST